MEVWGKLEWDLAMELFESLSLISWVMTIVGDRLGRRSPLQNSCMSTCEGKWRKERTLLFWPPPLPLPLFSPRQLPPPLMPPFSLTMEWLLVWWFLLSERPRFPPKSPCDGEMVIVRRTGGEGGRRSLVESRLVGVIVGDEFGDGEVDLGKGSCSINSIFSLWQRII